MKSRTLLARWAGKLGAMLLAGLLANSAQALPSYARQTGAECAACHVGGFGPQLTPFGIKFKIGGYTDSDGGNGKLPLSAMLVANTSHTGKGAADEDKLPNSSANNNTVMQEASVFLAGRLMENIGSFIQMTYSGIERKTSLDQFDLRYARNLQLAGKESTVGLSLNSNPTLTDPFNTLGQWRFPYTGSDYNAGFGPSPKVESLGGGVAGANAYLFFDNSLYAEIGLYNALNQRTTDKLNTDNVGKFKSPAAYWRLAYFQDRKRDNFSVGLFGFNASIQPDRTDLSGNSDRYRDLGIDAAYQFLGNRQHVATINASYVREWQTLGYTQGYLGEADNNKARLNQFRVAGSYHYNQTWGGTLAYFNTTGTLDQTVYGTSTSGRPNTTGYITQLDWTPWGKESSWGAPWANVRLGIQYTGYTRFMGGSNYLDGAGNERRAKDNNTTMLFLWTSI